MVPFQVLGDGANAIAMFPGVFVPEIPSLGNDRVFCHGSSSKIHITGSGKLLP
jgi:hypothetical protein